MSANPGTAAPTGRNKPAQGKERSDAALGHASQNTSSPDGAKQGGELRDGWRTAPFGEVVDILDSRRIPVNSAERAKRVGDVPYFGATGQVGVIDKHIFDDELVLLGEDGAPFLDSGKPKAYMIRGKSWVNNHAHVLRGKPGLLNGFLLYQLNNLDYRPYVSGTTRLKLPQGPMKQIPLLVPPLPEQRRIVSEIEKQFTRLEAGVAALRRVQANLKRYRAAVLKAACEGRLVPSEAELRRTADDADGADKKLRKSASSAKSAVNSSGYDTGAALLARILTERRQNWQGRGQYKEPAGPDTGKLSPLPDGWAWASVEQLLRESLCNGVSVKGSDNPPGVRALRLSAMSNSGFDYSDARYLPLPESDVDDLWIQEGDFFMSRGNGSLHLVGRGTSAQKPPQPTIFPDTMIRLRLADAVRKSGWVRTLWPSRIVRSQIETKVKTTAGIYKIAQPQVEGMVIPLPPLAEQTRIVAEVERRLSVVEELESLVSANLQRATRLRQSILQKAFTGKLLTADGADNTDKR